jgi:DNA-binding response OmpR family regulator/S1-C subfamily serine protease
LASKRESILVVEPDSASQQPIVELLRSAGYEVSATASADEGFDAVRNVGVDLLLLAADLGDLGCCQALSEIKGSAATAGTRVILLTPGGGRERARGLDLGADDVLSPPWEGAELLARVRTQLRAKQALADAEEKVRIAEQGQEIAHTAFQALAVTEKMTRDAFSLGRVLKIGVSALLAVAAVIAGIFVLYSRRAEKETRRAYAVIAQLERGVHREEDLIAEVRRARADLEEGPPASPKEPLKASESQKAEAVIREYAPSVCLLHVSVAFNDRASRARLRYGGITREGEPLKDSEGNPVFTLEGSAPEVRADFFGTGFLAGSGRILTNHHVVQPWWKNDEMNSVLEQGLDPLIAEMTAYFPDAEQGFRVEIVKISDTADLAVVRGDVSALRRPEFSLDAEKGATIQGQPLISMGYATGLGAILARAGEDVVQDIVKVSGGAPKQVMAELARRKLIRPLVTQGHIGDVLPDKIVYDAQTTSGGSGGPLLNLDGKVIGVTFAVVRGFGGSNFGVPIQYAEPLLKP